MSQRRRLPLPPRIDAIATVDEIEDFAGEFARREGYAPELLSHWDPKPDFEQVISSWIPRSDPPVSLIRYVYSSYFDVDDRIRRRLNEDSTRGLLLTPSGTSSIALILTYFANIDVRRLNVITPSYFALEMLAKTFKMSVSYSSVIRNRGRYYLPPDFSVRKNAIVWLTLPIYGTSSYPASIEIAAFVDRIRDDAIVVIDESLAYPDRNSIQQIKTLDRVIRITTSHKALCINGEKVSIVSLPRHLLDRLNAWSECLAGGIGAAGLRALQFLSSHHFDEAVVQMRALVDTSLQRMKRVIGSESKCKLDAETDGHFIMLYWPHLPMALSRSRKFLRETISASGAVPIPASRNRHPEQYGFAFRVNLLRLDEAGLGGLKRLASELDQKR